MQLSTLTANADEKHNCETEPNTAISPGITHFRMRNVEFFRYLDLYRYMYKFFDISKWFSGPLIRTQLIPTSSHRVWLFRLLDDRITGILRYPELFSVFSQSNCQSLTVLTKWEAVSMCAPWNSDKSLFVIRTVEAFRYPPPPATLPFYNVSFVLNNDVITKST